jgi:hypothetical protein
MLHPLAGRFYRTDAAVLITAVQKLTLTKSAAPRPTTAVQFTRTSPNSFIPLKKSRIVPPQNLQQKPGNSLGAFPSVYARGVPVLQLCENLFESTSCHYIEVGQESESSKNSRSYRKFRTKMGSIPDVSAIKSCASPTRYPLRRNQSAMAS